MFGKWFRRHPPQEPATLKLLVDAVLAHTITIAQVRERASGLRSSASLAQQIRELMIDVDQLRGEQPDYALTAMRVCHELSENVDDARLRGEIAFLLARSLMFVGQSGEAAAQLTEAERYFFLLGESRNLTLVKATQATLALTRGEFPAAAALYALVIARFQSEDDDINAASALLGYGQALNQVDQWQLARDAFDSALEIFAAKGLYIDEFKCLVLRANLAQKLGDDLGVLGYLQRAAATAKMAKIDTNEHSQVLGRLSASAARAAKYDIATMACEEGVELARVLKNPQLEGYFEGNLGSVLCQQGTPAAARAHLERALALAHKTGDAEGVRIAKHNIAQAKLLAGNTELDQPVAKPVVPQYGPRRVAPVQPANATVDKLLALARQRESTGKPVQDLLECIDQPDTAAAADELLATILEVAHRLESRNPGLAVGLVLLTEQWLSVRLSPGAMVKLYSRIAGYAMRANDMEGARKGFELAAEIARDNDLKVEFVAAATNLGSVLRQSGLTREAANVYSTALNASVDLEPRYRAMVLLNASTVGRELGQQDQAAIMCDEAVDILRSESDAADILLIALMNRGGARYSLARTAEAEADFVEAVNLARLEGNITQEGVALGHLGLLRFSNGMVSEAIRYFKRAAQLAESASDSWNAQHWYRDLANAYCWTGYYDAAEKNFRHALALSERVGDRRSEAVARLGIAITTSDAAYSADNLRRGWDIAQDTGNDVVALDIACHGVQLAANRAVGIDVAALSIENLTAFGGGFKLRNEEAFCDAKDWLAQALRLTKVLGLDAEDARLRMAQATVLRLEGRAIEAVTHLLAGLEKTKGMTRSTCEAWVGLLYFKDMGRPDLALPYLERALADRERTGAKLRGTEHRLSMRDETARLTQWTIECALALNQTEHAFAILEGSKISEIRRLRQAEHGTDGPSPPTLAEISVYAAQRKCAFVCFALLTDHCCVFLVTPNRVHPPLAMKMSTIMLSDFWLRIHNAYDKARSPAAAFDPGLAHAWSEELNVACKTIGGILEEALLPLIDASQVDEIIFVPQSLLHCFPLHAVVLNDGSALVERYSVTYAPSALNLVTGCFSQLPPTGPKQFVAFVDSLRDLPFARFEAVPSLSWGLSIQSFVGDEVTRATMLSNFNRADWIHIAGHARHVLGDDDLTGIYLAGVSDEDKLLSLRSIARDVRLRQGTVVVLSGCETGSVTPRVSDEYISLAGAFVAAGAGTVIASLWKVRDSAAVLLMRRFYNEIQTLQDMPRAFQRAQVWLRGLNVREARQVLSQFIPGSPDRERLLAEFETQDDNASPFSDVTDWGAFQIVSISLHDDRVTPE